MFGWVNKLKERFTRKTSKPPPSYKTSSARTRKSKTGPTDPYEEAYEREKAKQQEAAERRRAERQAREEAEYERMQEELAEEKRRAYQRAEVERAALESAIGELSPKEQKKFKQRFEKAKGQKANIAFEIWESGISNKKKVIHKVWNPQTHSWEFREVEVTLSPQERLAEARIQRLGGYLIEEEIANIEAARRERSLPYKAAKLLGGTAQLMAGTIAMGAAGTAQSLQLGRATRTGSRVFSAGLPLEVYSYRPVLGLRTPSPSLLTGEGLAHFRELTFPRLRRR